MCACVSEAMLRTSVLIQVYVLFPIRLEDWLERSGHQVSAKHFLDVLIGRAVLQPGEAALDEAAAHVLLHLLLLLAQAAPEARALDHALDAGNEEVPVPREPSGHVRCAVSVSVRVSV